jgi:hypothetical protein
MWNLLRRWLALVGLDLPPSDPFGRSRLGSGPLRGPADPRSRPGSGPLRGPADPYAWTSAPLKPRPGGRAGAVAVAEPDEDVHDDAVAGARSRFV